MSDIPDGVDSTVARMAIAWEIAKDAMIYSSETRGGAVTNDTGRVDIWVELFNKAFFSLKQKPE